MILTFLIRIGLILLALSACLALLNYTLRSSSKKKVEEGPSSASPSVDIQEKEAKVEPEEQVIVFAVTKEEKKTDEVADVEDVVDDVVEVVDVVEVDAEEKKEK